MRDLRTWRAPATGAGYAPTLCRDHEYLVGERHPDDGRIRDPRAAHVDGSCRLPADYGDPDIMRDDLLRMWSLGKAAMRDVQEILQMSRADVMYAAIDAGYGLHREEDDDAEERGAEMARLISEAKGEGTRH